MLPLTRREGKMYKEFDMLSVRILRKLGGMHWPMLKIITGISQVFCKAGMENQDDV